MSQQNDVANAFKGCGYALKILAMIGISVIVFWGSALGPALLGWWLSDQFHGIMNPVMRGWCAVGIALAGYAVLFGLNRVTRYFTRVMEWWG